MPTDKPNIVYIFSDQHRGDAMGCVGHPEVITPNLDKLSEEAVTFERCSTNSPLCMPARASMMTGQYVREHGIWTNNVEADPKACPSHVRNIRDAGYHTALIGKTHLYIHGGEKAETHARDHIPIMNDWGFVDTDELHGPLASRRMNSSYTDHLASKGLLEKHHAYIEHYFKGWASGTAYPWTEAPCQLPDEDHMDAYTGQRAVKWIKNYSWEKPFYLQVLFPGPHDPFDSPASYRDMYNPDEIPVGSMEMPREPIPQNVRGVLKWSGLEGEMTKENKQLMSSFYFAKITLIDEYIGRIVETLRERDMLDNTWIIYTSDHGEMLGDHMMSHKIVFYEGALRIPLIIRPPGGVNGWKSTALTDQLDHSATMIDIAGAEPIESNDARSLKPQVEAGPNDPGAQKGKDYVFSEVYGMSMIRDDRYKMAMDTQNSNQPGELFDLLEDPDEDRNLVNDAAYALVVKELEEAFHSRMAPRLNQEKYNHCFTVEKDSKQSLNKL